MHLYLKLDAGRMVAIFPQPAAQHEATEKIARPNFFTGKVCRP